jgi:hypothetical protein
LDPAIHRLSTQETSFDDGSPGDCGVLVVAGDWPTCQLMLVQIVTRQARVQFYRVYFRNYSGQTKLHPMDGDTTWFDRTARFLDLKRRTGESDDNFLVRLEQRRIELGRRYGGQANKFIVDA